MAGIGTEKKSAIPIVPIERSRRFEGSAKWHGAAPREPDDGDLLAASQSERLARPFGHRSVKLLFADFEFRIDSGELRRGEESVRVQPQPARVLEALARRSGEVVTRKELQHLVWGEGTHVDYEEGLNYCIKQLRRALGDVASRPRFIETVPRRGYRFVPEVRVGRSEPHVSIELEPPSEWRPITAVPRIFVSPLVEIGRSFPFEGFGRTLTEEIISSLHEQAAPQLCVLVCSPTPETAPRDTDADLILQGTVRADTGAVEVSVRLVELERQQQLWAKRYRVELSDEGGARAWDQQLAHSIVADVASRLGRAEGVLS